jgi:hypothetical protein
MSLKAVAKSFRHKLTHKPSNPHCDTCVRAKMKNRRKLAGTSTRVFKKFGDSFTCDHVVMARGFGNKGAGGFNDMFTMYDRASHSKYVDPVKSLDTLDVYTSLNHVQGGDPKQKIKEIHADGATQISKACKQLRIRFEPSQPGVHETNAVIENINNDILMGTRAQLLEAGHPACCWPWAAPCYAHNSNITPVGPVDELPDGTSVSTP